MMTSLVNLCAKTIVKNNIIINEPVPDEMWDKILYYSHIETLPDNKWKFVKHIVEAYNTYIFKNWLYPNEFIPLLGRIPMMWYGIEILPGHVIDDFIHNMIRLMDMDNQENTDILDEDLIDIYEKHCETTFVCISQMRSHSIIHGSIHNYTMCGMGSHVFENLQTKTCQCKFFN